MYTIELHVRIVTITRALNVPGRGGAKCRAATVVVTTQQTKQNMHAFNGPISEVTALYFCRHSTLLLLLL